VTRPGSLAPVLVLVAGLAAIYPLQTWLDRYSKENREEEILYLSDGETVKRLALGYESVLADLYWMRTIQYFGNKAIEDPNAALEAKGDMKMLYPLLDVTTTLDPNFMPPYRLGSYFLYYSSSPDEAFRLLEKGIRNNPDNVRLYQDLAFFKWSSGECEEAARLYSEASRLPGAQRWLATMSAVVLAECGKRDFAVRMLEGMLESTDDPRMRADFEARLLGYRALDEIDYLERGVAFFREQAGRFPSSLQELTRSVRFPSDPAAPKIKVDASGAPVDPSGEPYVYDPTTGEITTKALYLPRPIVLREQPKAAP
jgi:tetratricopeptide (TPR) repeat protein